RAGYYAAVAAGAFRSSRNAGNPSPGSDGPYQQRPTGGSFRWKAARNFFARAGYAFLTAQRWCWDEVNWQMRTGYSFIGLGLLLVGLPVYFFWADGNRIENARGPSTNANDRLS